MEAVTSTISKGVSSKAEAKKEWEAAPPGGGFGNSLLTIHIGGHLTSEVRVGGSATWWWFWETKLPNKNVLG